jgi:HNH endonuclease/AP2 domain
MTATGKWTQPGVPHKGDLTCEMVRELLHYDPATGLFEWKMRDRKWFRSDHHWKTWNAKHAGKPAFTYVDSRGYCAGGILGLSIRAHCVAFLYVEGRWANPGVDHKNTVYADNRWDNLRETTQQQNTFNQKRRSTNTSGFKGVYRSKSRRMWVAQININGRSTYLGSFDRASAASLAYAEAATEHYGEFARLD